MDELNALIRLVEKTIRTLSVRLRENVEGFKDVPIEAEEWRSKVRRSYANEIAYALMTGCCRCGLKHCSQQHNLTARQQSELRQLDAFVYCAVIGPYGLRANSIPQGMKFLLLRDEWRLRAVMGEFKQCHNDSCRREYEGNTCVYCGSLFAPDPTRIQI